MTNLKVVYMINGMMMVGEVDDSGEKLKIKACVGFIPGQNNQLGILDPFPISSSSEYLVLEPTSYMTYGDVTDANIINTYEDAITKMRAAKAGLVT